MTRTPTGLLAPAISAIMLVQCADTTTKSTASADPNCQIEMHTGLVRAGENAPAHMRVVNNGKWCRGGYGLSGISSQAARLVDEPSHGEARMRQLASGVLYEYRPKPGYIGSDRFLIAIPTPLAGYDVNLAMTVEVVPPG